MFNVKYLFVIIIGMLFMSLTCFASSLNININNKNYKIHEVNTKQKSFASILCLEENENSYNWTSRITLTKYFVFVNQASYIKSLTAQKYGKINLSHHTAQEGATVSYLLNNTTKKELQYVVNRFIRKNDHFYTYIFEKRISTKGLNSTQIQKIINQTTQQDKILSNEIKNLPIYDNEITDIHQ